LFIVFAVVGIVAAIALPTYWSTRLEAFRAAAIHDLRSLATAHEVYWRVEIGYVASLQDLSFFVSEPISLSITEATVSGWAALAGHTSFPAASRCGRYFGTADPANGSHATVSVKIVCSR